MKSCIRKCILDLFGDIYGDACVEKGEWEIFMKYCQ